MFLLTVVFSHWTVERATMSCDDVYFSFQRVKNSIFVPPFVSINQDCYFVKACNNA